MLRTSRAYLRNLCSDDVDALFEYRNDPTCMQYQRYENTSRSYLQDFVTAYSHCKFPSTEEEQHYALICSLNNRMIGDTSIFFSKKDNCFTLGITIAPEYQRQGYAYEILSAVTAQLHDHYPAVDIVALIDKNNVKSISLFQKLGFTEECYAESIESYVFTKYGSTN